ncbi:unnamed protein product, partial [Prorocentrum cordatum]
YLLAAADAVPLRPGEPGPAAWPPARGRRLAAAVGAAAAAAADQVGASPRPARPWDERQAARCGAERPRGGRSRPRARDQDAAARAGRVLRQRRRIRPRQPPERVLRDAARGARGALAGEAPRPRVAVRAPERRGRGAAGGARAAGRAGCEAEGPGVRAAIEIAQHEKTCIVCLDDIVDGQSVRPLARCGHKFHAACLERWTATMREA